MCVRSKKWVRMTITAAAVMVVAVSAQAPQDNLQISVQVNQTQVTELSVSEGEFVSVTFVAAPPSPFSNSHFLIEEQSPDGMSHVMVVPARIKVEGGMTLTTDGTVVGSFKLSGVLLGFTKIIFTLVTDQGEIQLISMPLSIKVQRMSNALEKIFSRCLLVVITVVYINMGCTLDIGGIADTLKRPYAPVIGLFLQHFLMPMVSYGMGYVLFREEPAFWLGMLIVGSCPGGGGSNTWTHLLDGILPLSITMTFISIVFAFIALPFWFYLLGDTIFQRGVKHLPYGEMAGLMFGILLPCAVGIFINHFLPRVATVLRSLLGPAVVIFVLLATTFSVVTNLYIFGLFTWKVALAGMALPWTGFAFGAVAGLVCSRPWQEVMTIAIETGIQNTGLAISIIKVVLDGWSPLGDLIVVIAVAVALLTLPPLLVALATKISLSYCTTAHPREDSDGTSVHEKPDTSKTPLHSTNYGATS